ncbi:Lrp/AsnC family transcriptional regulator, partial [Novosphingobium sp. ERN07]|uniref:Lrp/AsnC family transcriptional regulator n=1 Tax=Novosphingobium sp. ERN07 TaxID=2726187 RepID=UPI001F1147B3
MISGLADRCPAKTSAKSAFRLRKTAQNAVDCPALAAQTRNASAVHAPDAAHVMLRGGMSQVFSFDATDIAIIRGLRANGRANNQQIAETLGLTATTVSTRIRRMEDA